MEKKEKNPFENIIDVGQAEHIFNQFRITNPNDSDAQLDMLSDLLDALLNAADPLIGDADDFHNFAVTVSKVANDNKGAYEIVRKGLDIHRVNTDLLADALMYGANAGQWEECQKWYKVIMGVDKSCWTWRAFSFTLTYLLDVYASSDDNIASIDDIIALAKEYQKWLPDREDAWISLYRLYERINQRAEGIKVLEEAIDKFKFCPKCWLRYADLMVDDGEYAKAEPIIKKMLRSPNSTEHINTSYMYFLDGQCKMARLMESEDYELGIVDEKDVIRVYRAFKLARKSQGLRESVNQRIEEYIDRLTIETEIPYEE